MKKWLALLFLLAPLPALAFTHDGAEEEPLFFGQLLITDNSAVRTCIIPAGGTESCDPAISIMHAGNFGTLRLSGFDPSVAVFATVDDSLTTLTNAGGQALDIKNFTFDPDIRDIGTAMTPNADGTLTLKIGASLKTRAGIAYDVSPYHGTFSLQINY